MRKSVLPLSPYPTSLVLRLLLDEKQARKHLDKDTLAITSLLENNIILIDFDLTAPRRKDKQFLLSTAVHESVHVVLFVLKVIDSPLDLESAAYLTQRVYCYIMTQIAKALKH